MFPNEGRPSRRRQYTLGAVVGGAAISALIYYTMYRVELNIATDTMEKVTGDIQKNTARMVEDMRRNAEAARQASLEKEARERQEKAAAQHADAAAKQAAIDSAAVKEAAWDRYYKPSEKCQSYDARATMDCANEHVRAKRAFEAKWAAGAVSQ